jgi:hypothetical protein
MGFRACPVPPGCSAPPCWLPGVRRRLWMPWTLHGVFFAPALALLNIEAPENGGSVVEALPTLRFISWKLCKNLT